MSGLGTPKPAGEWHKRTDERIAMLSRKKIGGKFRNFPSRCSLRDQFSHSHGEPNLCNFGLAF